MPGAFVLTARQYGEVVLPDAASGQGPGTPSTRGQKAVTVQGGYGVLFAVMVQILLRVGAIAVQFYRNREFIPGYKVVGGHWRSVAVQTVSEPENCQDAGFILRAGARVRMQDVKRIYMASRAGNDDK